LLTHYIALDRWRDARSLVIAAAKTVFQTVGAVVLLVAGVFGVICVSFQAAAPPPEGQLGSGHVLRTDVTAIWLPQPLHDLARSESGPHVVRSSEELRTYLERHGMNAAWYALTSRGYRVDGDSAMITQVRRISEAPEHIEEFQEVMSTAAGNPPRSESRDFSHATVSIIPDELLTADPRTGVAELMAPHDARK
jgi:hypothetical protein